MPMMNLPCNGGHHLAHNHNSLIEALPARERKLLVANAQTVPLLMHTVECEADAPVDSVLFPLSGFLSLVVKLEDAPGMEVGMVGSEGMVGVSLALGAKTLPWHIVVQGEGEALKLASKVFGKLLTQCPALQQQMHHYAYVVLDQTATMSACNRFHTVHQRLSRWLLMNHDRAQADSFLMTQEFLAYMLGVRRVSITQAASALQAADLIRYRRGSIEIVSRAGLELEACSCYRQSLGVYARAFLSIGIEHCLQRKNSVDF